MSAHDWAVAWYESLAVSPQDIVLGDPGGPGMFDDRVYKRGALCLHALRVSLGDKVFFDGVREWTTRHRHGNVDTADLIACFSKVAGRDVAEVIDPWLYGATLPQLPHQQV